MREGCEYLWWGEMQYAKSCYKKRRWLGVLAQMVWNPATKDFFAIIR